MNILVLGTGAREHAVAWKLAQSRRVSRVFAGPGNAGTGDVAENLPDVDPNRHETVLAACRSRRIDCVFVGPEAPLAGGIVDALSAAGIAAIGPSRRCARLESSKAFAKEFLERHGIPTAAAERFVDPAAFTAWMDRQPDTPRVVKKSGLAAGKGVLVSGDRAALARFGRTILDGGDELLVEECLEGWEVSVFGVSDGKDHLVLAPCTDFKRAYDGDAGPNTGGMGAVCPVPTADEALMERVRREIVDPTYAALQRDGLAYAGVLYFGLMVTAQGPRVLEFNVRFGDPETQVLLPVLEDDLGELLEAMASASLRRLLSRPTGSPPAVRRPRRAAVGVVIASRGYPEASEKGVPVDPIPGGGGGGPLVFHASTVRDASGRLLTGGGRCFTVVGLGPDLVAARDRAYAAVPTVRFAGGWCRGDIGARFTGGHA